MSQARSLARQRALQALYQWQMTGQSISDIEVQFVEGEEMKGVEVGYFRELLHKILAEVSSLDGQIAPLLDRPVEQLDPVERAILLLSAFELIHKLEIPYRVVINEGVELAKLFGAEQSHKFVNGILDRLAQQSRPVEVAARADKRRKTPTIKTRPQPKIRNARISRKDKSEK